MTTETISIEVDPATAQAYRESDQQRRAKLAILIRWRLKEFLERDDRTLEEIMRDMSREAQARGLTPEILQSILDDDDDE